MAIIDTQRPSGLVYRIPVLGWFARDLARDFHGNIYYFLVILLTLLVLAVKTWGLVALTMVGVTATPLMFVVLMLITVGK
ncbi:hypothetical protein [Mesobacterium pallidum]|uniref:hypothetical protein n=1 Tax=Mesobacterium pallidum TaxID=2872037 RepID=UPI001EE36385|nr:hypothetical protein [Mesobacterium pallidum]